MSNPEPTEHNKELDDKLMELLPGITDVEHIKITRLIEAREQTIKAEAVQEYRDKISTGGRPLSAEPLIDSGATCSDCGNKFADWSLLPHQVFNAVCPGGAGFLCLPCFAARLCDDDEAISKLREKERRAS